MTLPAVRSPLTKYIIACFVFISTESLLANLGLSADTVVPLPMLLTKALSTFPLVAALFYINTYFIIDRYLLRRRWMWLALATIGLLVSFAMLRVSVFDAFRAYGYYDGLTKHFLFDTLRIGMQYLLLSYTYWLSVYAIRLARRKPLLKQDRFADEKTQLKAELMFLRDQSNANLLSTTLNLLHTQAVNSPSKLADSVLALTVMMRNITEIGREPLMPVSHELDYIYHYLTVQHYRFKGQMKLRFKVEGETFAPVVKVPPLLFISLIERFFEYSNPTNAADPAEITFSVEHDNVRFYCRSCKKKLVGSAVLYTDTQLAGIRQQLQEYFPVSHQLSINDTATHHILELVIKITRPMTTAIPNRTLNEADQL